VKFLIHPLEVPRKLASRRMKPVGDPTKAWKDFKGTVEIHRSLIPAQNYLCAYCEIELVRGAEEIGYHIEHINLKSENAEQTFEFSNLLISCFDTGYETHSSSDDPNPISCGHAQGKKNSFDTLLFIKPTEQGCENYFYYELDGRIVPNPGLSEAIDIDKVNYTINLLNLNCRRLKRKRKDLIVKGMGIINSLLDSPDALSYFAMAELEKINDKHRSFFTTRRQFFQSFILESEYGGDSF